MASPGLSGVAALLMAFSTSSSITFKTPKQSSTAGHQNSDTVTFGWHGCQAHPVRHPSPGRDALAEVSENTDDDHTRLETVRTSLSNENPSGHKLIKHVKDGRRGTRGSAVYLMTCLLTWWYNLLFRNVPVNYCDRFIWIFVRTEQPLHNQCYYMIILAL